MKWTSTGVLAGMCVLSSAQAVERLAPAEAPEVIVDASREAESGTGKTMSAVLLGKEGEARFGEPEDDSLYFDTTPICNYLERGLDDQQPGQRDGYVVQPPGVDTLSDIDRIAFGLDLPAKRCTDNPRTVPCIAEADPKSWCVQRVELEVLGMKLVDLSGPSRGCLLTAHGGTDEAGISHINRNTLRGLPTWGLSDADVERLLGSLRRGPDGEPAFLPSMLVMPGEFIARMVETQVGQALTRDAIGCTNPLYCGHRPAQAQETGGSKLPTMRLANTQEADCDLGNCPPASARKSSPWVEVAGSNVGGQPSLQLDIDFAVERDRIIDTECSDLDNTRHCAVQKVMVVHGSVELPMTVACVPFAHVAVPQEDLSPPDIDGSLAIGHNEVPADVMRRLPYCGEGVPGVCFQPGLNALHGTVLCPGDEDDAACGAAADVERATFDQRVEVGEPWIDIEGGLASDAGELLCALVSFLSGEDCNVDVIANTLFGGQINGRLGGVSGVPLFTELAGCPEAQAGADGTLSFNFAALDACYPGSPVPGCFGLVGGQAGEQSAFKRGDGADDFAAVPDADPAPLPSAWTIGGTAAGPVQIGGLIAAPPKHTFAELNEAVEKVCALAAACDPALDLQRLPLRDLAGISVANIEAAIAGFDIDAAWAEIGFLADNPAFRNDCMAHHLPGYNGARPVSDAEKMIFLLHLQAWVTDHLEPGFATCEAQNTNIEAMLPTLGMTLRVTSGGSTVRDRFAFVNFKNNADVTDDERAVAACGFRESQGLPMADAPRCGPDGTITHGPDEAIGQLCGTVAGGPCADFTAEYYHNDFADFGGIGNDPSAVNKHPNGSAAWNLRCFPDEHTSEPLVCVTDFYPGAGLNAWPTCKICGVAPDGEDASRYTMDGCPPEGAECPEGYALGSDGKCWDAYQGRPIWECPADCTSIYGDTGYCQHAGPWLDFMKEDIAAINAVSLEEGPPHPVSICVDWHCPDAGIRCGWQGKACFNGDECVDECFETADCQDGDLNYPAGFVCGPTLSCVPPG